MDTILAVLGVVVGVALVLAVYDSALRTFVLPRGVSNPLTRMTFQALRWVFSLRARVAQLRGARPGDGSVRADRPVQPRRSCGWPS